MGRRHDLGRQYSACTLYADEEFPVKLRLLQFREVVAEESEEWRLLQQQDKVFFQSADEGKCRHSC